MTKKLSILLIIIFIGVLGAACADKSTPTSLTRTTTNTTAENSTTVTETPDDEADETTLPAPVVTVPSDWKEITAGKDYVKTTLALPDGFVFRFSGSESDVANDVTGEAWDYSTSVDVNSPENFYAGGSRRAWYKSYLQSDEQLIRVIEHPINTTSYLSAIVQGAPGSSERRYLFLQNGVVHILRPISEKASSNTAELPKILDKVFVSLRSEIVQEAIGATE